MLSLALSVRSLLRSSAGELLLQADKDARAQRHALAKTLDDAEIVARIFQRATNPSADEGAALDDSTASSAEHPAAPSAAPSLDDAHRVKGFLMWYHGVEGPSAARRDGACARLFRALQSSGSAARRAADKSAAKRAKRARQRAEKMSKNSTAMAKAVADAAERQRQRITRGGQEAARRVAIVVEARRARLVRGERGWALRGRWVVEQLLPAAGAMAAVDVEAEAKDDDEYVGGSGEEYEDEAAKDDKEFGAIPSSSSYDGFEAAAQSRRRKRILRVPFSSERGGDGGAAAAGGGAAVAGSADTPSRLASDSGSAGEAVPLRRRISMRRKKAEAKAEAVKLEAKAEAPHALPTAVELAVAGPGMLEMREQKKDQHSGTDQPPVDVTDRLAAMSEGGAYAASSGGGAGHSRVPSGVPSTGASEATSEALTFESSA